MALPNANVPVVDPKTGIVSVAWYRFLILLSQVTGLVPTAPVSPVPIVPGGSPFTYSATSDGALFVSGGGVSAMRLIRSGQVVPVGHFYGSFPMSIGDRMQIVFPATAPTITFLSE